MTDEETLIAAIKAAPDDDLPRLVYADWLDERGRHSQAHFVRWQCENGRHVTLTRSEADFGYRIEPHDWYRVPLPPGMSAGMSRGFILWVGCPADTWLAHGDDILARHPLRRVVLTTRPELTQTALLVPPAWGTEPAFGLIGDPRRERYFRSALRPADDAAAVLALRYPGVEFELPPFVTSGPLHGGGTWRLRVNGRDAGPAAVDVNEPGLVRVDLPAGATATPGEVTVRVDGFFG